ncbi:hypothetical protein [Serratia fonticola]|uniref:hypothetical protein n=1 Tax=Serratia fonticola TaxID=47917 RepID=UPI00217A397F|nr:hypothetical protein [Serratia fonticola]CAI1544031.1 Uncharacterised protein [Serratia fonticola]
MKKIMLGITVIAVSLFSAFSFADENYDLKCTLDSGEKMTVSHSSDSIYIEVGMPGKGNVIKLDVPSGEAQQKPGIKTMRAFDYLLYGTNNGTPNIVQVGYAKNPYGEKMYFATMNKSNKKVTKIDCVPSTIKVANTVTQNGIIFDLASFAGRDGNDPNAIKLKLDQIYDRYAPNKNYNSYWWKFTIIAQRTGVKVWGFDINRSSKECDVYPESYTAKLLNFGDNTYFKIPSNKDYTKCTPQEVIVKTNFGIHKFNFNQ